MTMRRTRNVAYGIVIGLTLLTAFVVIWLASPPPGHAQEIAYTAEDTIAAIDEASAEIGVDWTWLYNTVRCETGGTFDPYSVGKQGELGAAQLHPRGELPRFYDWGYVDPYSPYQAVRFLAQRKTMGGARAWTCAR